MGPHHAALDETRRISGPGLLLRVQGLRGNVDLRDGPGSRLRAGYKNKDTRERNRRAFRSRGSRGARLSRTLRRPHDAQPGANGQYPGPRHHRPGRRRFAGAAPVSQRAVATEGVRFWPRSRYSHHRGQARRRQRRAWCRLAVAAGTPLEILVSDRGAADRRESTKKIVSEFRLLAARAQSTAHTAPASRKAAAPVSLAPASEQ